MLCNLCGVFLTLDGSKTMENTQLSGIMGKWHQDAWILLVLMEALKMKQVGITNGFWFNFLRIRLLQPHLSDSVMEGNINYN